VAGAIFEWFFYSTREMDMKLIRKPWHRFFICSLIFCSIFFGVVLPALADPETKERTKLDITISTAESVNLDGKQRANPIEIRVYELKSSQTFDSADFFSLQTKDKELLAADLLKVDIFLMKPGEEKKIVRKSDDKTTAIGIVAGYRNLDHSIWRMTQALPEAPVAAWYRSSNKFVLKVSAEETGLKVILLEK
jgi:type VI secretion system protein VasD